jgi:GxxExxY protein
MADDALTATIIGCAFKAHQALGSGFLEKVYENALRIDLIKQGLRVKQQEQSRSGTKTKWLAITVLTCSSKSESSLS